MLIMLYTCIYMYINVLLAELDRVIDLYSDTADEFHASIAANVNRFK